MNHYIEFEKAVKNMELPEFRKVANAANVLWFLKSGIVENREHPNIMNAIFHANRISS
jgi:hypothetical protein